MNKKRHVSVKALLAHEHTGEILLLREASGTNKGKYHFPGGHVSPGEQLEKALRRELAEETGITNMVVGG